MTEQPPLCHRCRAHIADHEATGVDTCAGYVWPGSFTAAWLDFAEACSALGRELMAPFERLLAKIARQDGSSQR